MPKGFKPHDNIRPDLTTSQYLRTLNTKELDAWYFNTLKSFAGYLQNGSQTSINISADDATFDYTLTVGKNNYHGSSIEHCIEKAYNADEWKK